jgi:SAM-dependent methyltransferase
MKTLAIGSGIMKPDQNVVRLDISPETGADVIWDLNVFPYPFEDSSFDRIECFDVIEHVSNIPMVVQECHRILKNKGIFYITTPHYSSNNSYIDPTHKFHLSYFSFDCFSDEHKYHYYSKARFSMIQKKMMFDGGVLRKYLLNKIGNKCPEFYEKRLAWIFPAWFLYFEMQAIKN